MEYVYEGLQLLACGIFGGLVGLGVAKLWIWFERK